MKRREISLIFIHGRLGLEFVMVVATRIIKGTQPGKILFVLVRLVSIQLSFFFALFLFSLLVAGVILLLIIRCMFLNHK